MDHYKAHLNICFKPLLPYIPLLKNLPRSNHITSASISNFFSITYCAEHKVFIDIKSCFIHLVWLLIKVFKFKLLKTIQTSIHLHTNLQYFSRSSSAATFIEEQETKIRKRKLVWTFLLFTSSNNTMNHEQKKLTLNWNNFLFSWKCYV